MDLGAAEEKVIRTTYHLPDVITVFQEIPEQPDCPEIEAQFSVVAV